MAAFIKIPPRIVSAYEPAYVEVSGNSANLVLYEVSTPRKSISLEREPSETGTAAFDLRGIFKNSFYPGVSVRAIDLRYIDFQLIGQYAMAGDSTRRYYIRRAEQFGKVVRYENEPPAVLTTLKPVAYDGYPLDLAVFDRAAVLNLTGILIFGRVIDAISGRGVPGAQVAITLGDHPITSAISDANGNFAYSWQISESEYTALIAQFGMTVRWSAQGSGYLSGKGIFGYLQTYQDAVQYGVNYTIILGNISDFWVDPAEIVFDVVGGAMILTVHFPNTNWTQDTYVNWASVDRDSDTTILIEAGVNTSGFDREGIIYIDVEDFGETITVGVPVRQLHGDLLRLTNIPIGLNLRGATIVFTDTDRPMTDRSMFDNEYSMGPAAGTSDKPGYFVIFSSFDDEDHIMLYAVGASGLVQSVPWNINTGWQQTSFTFPDDVDFIVGYSSIRPAVGDSWGWDHAYIINAAQLTADKIPVGFNLRGLKFEFQNVDKPIDPSLFENGGQLLGTSPNWGAFWARAIPADGTNPDVLRVSQRDGVLSSTVWRRDLGWISLIVAFPSNQDFIVSENTLSPSAEGFWGWGDVIITG